MKWPLIITAQRARKMALKMYHDDGVGAGIPARVRKLWRFLYQSTG